jgi:hypothetical protein
LIDFLFVFNVFGLGEGGGFRSTKLAATIELDTKHKASFNH